MPDQTNDEASQEIRRFFDRLAARHGLDSQTTQELCGHLEEKLIGYLSGGIPVTTQDAMLLVRAHFGDADRICEMLGGRAGMSAWRYAARRRALLWVAAVAAVLMLFVVPACALGMGAGLRAVLAIAGWMAVLETGVLLAARADLRSVWQRAISVAFLLPTTGILCLLLGKGVVPLTVPPPRHFAEVKFLFSVIGSFAVVGHVGLLAFLTWPDRTRLRIPTLRG